MSASHWAVATLAVVPCHDSWPIVLGAGVLAAILVLLWSQSGTRGLLPAAMVALVVAGASAAIDRIVVTDREAIENLFDHLATAAERADAATILAAFDPAVEPPRAAAEQALRDFRPEEVRITRIDVALQGTGPGRSARADLLVHARGNFQGAGGIGAGAFLVDLRVDLRESGGSWLITDFDAREGRPGRRD